MDETEIVRECQQGNRDAFRFIVERYGDTLFGTAYLPKRWPARYGIDGDPVPLGWLRQLVWPFRRPQGEVD